VQNPDVSDSNSPALASAERRVRLAARALARHGLVHAYGHCSERLDANHFLVCAARPMGLIAAGEPGVIVPVVGPLPDGVLGEVRIHQQLAAGLEAESVVLDGPACAERATSSGLIFERMWDYLTAGDAEAGSP
jgi:hypothetical protein